MAKYILLTEIKTEAEDAEWWDEQTDCGETVKIFDSFDTAKSEMRKTVKRILKKCNDFVPFWDGRYAPLTEYTSCPGVDELDQVIRKTIEDPTYFCKDPAFHVKYVDDGDCYCAFVGNKDLILAKDYCGKTLKMNIHNMADSSKPYYFVYEETDFDGSNDSAVINAISVRLLTDAKRKKKRVRSEQPKNYETVTFGRYVQDRDGKTASPLTWRVLDKKDGMTLLITEKVIDKLAFSAKRDNAWKNSDLRRWLNREFIDTAFNSAEKEKIVSALPDARVFLLSLDEYKQYLSDPNEAGVSYTSYSRPTKSGEGYRTHKRGPYALWWLRTANENGGIVSGLYAACGSEIMKPSVRADLLCGVRPAIWVKTDD